MAIHKADIATTEDIAIALGHAIEGAYGSVVYVDVCLAEDETIGVAIGLILGLPVVEASTAAKDISQHMAAPHCDVSLTGLVNLYFELVRSILGLCSASNGSNLTSAIHTIADYTIP